MRESDLPLPPPPPQPVPSPLPAPTVADEGRESSRKIDSLDQTRFNDLGASAEYNFLNIYQNLDYEDDFYENPYYILDVDFIYLSEIIFLHRFLIKQYLFFF